MYGDGGDGPSLSIIQPHSDPVELSYHTTYRLIHEYAALIQPGYHFLFQTEERSSALEIYVQHIDILNTFIHSICTNGRQRMFVNYVLDNFCAIPKAVLLRTIPTLDYSYYLKLVRSVYVAAEQLVERI